MSDQRIDYLLDVYIKTLLADSEAKGNFVLWATLTRNHDLLCHLLDNEFRDTPMSSKKAKKLKEGHGKSQILLQKYPPSMDPDFVRMVVASV